MPGPVSLSGEGPFDKTPKIPKHFFERTEPMQEPNQIPQNVSVDIIKRFTYHPPKEGQPLTYEQIRDTAKSFAMLLAGLCPESRERSLALTKLEEVVFWANASIARKP